VNDALNKQCGVVDLIEREILSFTPSSIMLLRRASGNENSKNRGDDSAI